MRSSGTRRASSWPAAPTIWPSKSGAWTGTPVFTTSRLTTKRSTPSSGPAPALERRIPTPTLSWPLRRSTPPWGCGMLRGESRFTRSPATRNRSTRSHSLRTASTWPQARSTSVFTSGAHKLENWWVLLAHACDGYSSNHPMPSKCLVLAQAFNYSDSYRNFTCAALSNTIQLFTKLSTTQFFPGPLVQGHRRHFRGLLEQPRRQGRRLGLRRNSFRPRSQKVTLRRPRNRRDVLSKFWIKISPFMIMSGSFFRHWRAREIVKYWPYYRRMYVGRLVANR